MDNPWLELTSSSEKILSSDKSHIMLFNRDYCKLNDHKIMTNLLPEPFYGNVNAHIYLLALNPGYSEGEEEWHQDNNFLQALKLNLSHSYQKYPNYFFNPEFASHPGSKWWKSKTRWFLQDLPQEKREVVLSNNLFCVEYFPYHSKRFKKLPSKILGKEISDRDKYTIYLLKKAIEENKAIVILRSFKLWCELVPELSVYENIFHIKNPQNVSLSPNNVDRFEELSQFIDTL